MKFPRNNCELNEIFKDARTPELSEFNGEYFVDMLIGLPSLRKFSHRKVFYTENDKVLGYNIFFTKKVWGRFFLEQGICEEADSVNPVKKDEVLDSTIFSKKGSELYSSAAQGVGLSNGIKVVIINYDRKENSFITNRIRDYIKCVEKNIYLGRFNYLFMGKPRFLGYFSLSKIK